MRIQFYSSAIKSVSLILFSYIEDDIGYIKSSHTDLLSSKGTRSKVQTLLSKGECVHIVQIVSQLSARFLMELRTNKAIGDLLSCLKLGM